MKKQQALVPKPGGSRTLSFLGGEKQRDATGNEEGAANPTSV